MPLKLGGDMSQERTARVATYPIEPLILHRWSPRSMSGEAMTDEELRALFEAAHWAPSSYNAQPWRFLYAKRHTPQWDTFFQLMVPFNQSWTAQAACLVVVIAKKTFDHNGKWNPTHAYDAGAAWMALALEASARHYVAHGMAGFDYDKAKKDLHVSDDYEVLAMIAIGKSAPKDQLPAELQAKEEPSPRRPLEEVIREGGF